MDLYARVNILDGRAVRLPHGRLDEAIALDNDPIGRAEGWVRQGVDYIHIVDLDAAAYSDYRNRPLIARLVAQSTIPVQVAGGVRSEGEAERLIEAGAWRIVMGTAAIETQLMVWDLCRRFPGKIAVSLDVRPSEEIAVRGWTQNSGRFLEEVLIEMSSAGVAAFLVSEAGRDVLMEPPNLEILAEAIAGVEEPVIASGGVRNLEDLRHLMQLESSGRKVEGLIVGREVTEGRFTIAEAKEVLAGGGPRRAPGGVASTQVSVAVGSLREALEFYETVLGFAHVRSPSRGVSSAVVEAAPGQWIELVEGGASRPERVVLHVGDLDDWRGHFAGLGTAVVAEGDGFEVVDPDGLTIRFEPA